MDLSLTINKDGDNAVIYIDGQVNTSTAPQLEDIISSNINDISSLEINMEKCSYISSACIRVLMYAYKKLTSKGGTLRITGVNDALLEIFESTNLMAIFDIERLKK